MDCPVSTLLYLYHVGADIEQVKSDGKNNWIEIIYIFKIRGTFYVNIRFEFDRIAENLRLKKFKKKLLGLLDVWGIFKVGKY